jgi:DNA-binding GntR family transcriptional regulator
MAVDPLESESLPVALAGTRPKGEQLREVLEQLIAALGPGALIPSERVLAERYDVARMTVRKELDRLVAEGAAYRVQGRGTFVADRRILYANPLTSFSDDIRRRGMTPGAEVIDQSLVEADDALAAALERPPGTAVVRVERVRTADGEPIALEVAHLPAGDFPGLERVRLSDRSLVEVLADRYGVVLAQAAQRVSAVALSVEEAAHLHTGPGRPAFLFRRTTRRATGRVVEYTRSLYRGDRYEIEMRQEAP